MNKIANHNLHSIIKVAISYKFLENISNSNQDLDELGPTKAPIIIRKARRLRRKRQQHPTNSIGIENEENGKATIMPVTAARYAETIKLNEYAERSKQDYTIYDGPLDSSSNYTGFLEVIGEYLLILQKFSKNCKYPTI